MSKGNMLLGHARGKVGDLVFSRVNGQQVTRARAAVVKNPQTEAQTIQRILLNTTIQAYSRMSEICDHSFEGVPTGQQSMSTFMKRNLAKSRQYVSDAVNIDGLNFDEIYAFAPIGSNEFAMNEYVIASGSLPSVTIAELDPVDGAKVAVIAASDTLTYGDVITSLGLNRGDQLTFISQEAWTDRRAAFNFARVILDPRDAAGAQLPLDTPFLNGTAINMPNPRNEGAEMVFSYGNGNLVFNRSDRSQFGAAVIVSRQRSDGSWLRSNTTITLFDATNLLVNARSLQECLDLFAAGSIDVENPLYLNNARRVTGASVRTAGGFAFTGVQWAPNSAWDSDGGSAVSLELVSVAQATEAGAPIVYVTDVNGNQYALVSLNASSGTYGSIFGKMDAASQSAAGAWRRDLITGESASRTYVGTKPLINVYPSTGDAQVNDFILWLQSKGCNIGAFVNP